MKNEEIGRNMIFDLLRRVSSNSLEFNLAIGIGLICPLLYLISPEDSNIAFPSIYASRYLWTELIPISISLFVVIATYQTLMGKFSTFETKFASIFIIFLVFMSIQFATTSPVGVDGWFFLENAQYFSRFGESGRMVYDSHPLVLMPVDFHIRIFGSNGRNVAMLFGFLMSIHWINTIASASSKATNFRHTGVIIFSAISIYFLASGWYPLRYTAHLLALTLGHYLIHREADKLTIADISIAFFLAISHPFSPLVFGCILFVDAFSRRARSRRSQILYLIISLTFLAYNLEGLTTRFENRGIELFSSLLVRCLLFSVPLVFFGIQLIVERKWDSRGKELTRTGSGVSNISVLIGCIIAIPFLIVADNQTGASRFTHRLVTYAIVPLIFVSDSYLFRLKEFVSSITKEEVFNFGVALICLCNSFGVAFLHISHVRSAEVMPENATECWSMVENSGVLSVIEQGQKDGLVLIISDQTHPPVSNVFYYNFIKTGDGSRLPGTSPDKVIGLLEIPGMFDKVFTYEHVSTIEWVVVSEESGACRLWLDSNYLDDLENDYVSWKQLDAHDI